MKNQNTINWLSTRNAKEWGTVIGNGVTLLIYLYVKFDFFNRLSKIPS